MMLGWRLGMGLGDALDSTGDPRLAISWDMGG
jgi:hypothetical protein